MAEQLTVLIAPLDAVGHFMSCLGIAGHLRDRGHKVVFATPDTWRNKLAPQGFFEEWLNPELPEANSEKQLQAFNQLVTQMGPAFAMDPQDQIRSLSLVFFEEVVRQTKEFHPRLKEIVANVKPDVIIADLLAHQPAVMNAGIPWILSVSIGATGISGKNLPPSLHGYPTIAADQTLWKKSYEIYRTAFGPAAEDFRTWLLENGEPNWKFYQPPLFLKYSPYANMYMCPEELDYTNIRPNPPNFHRVDTFIRTSNEVFQFPEELKNQPGKLVYFSMGTLGCAEVVMMKRLIAILAKSPHRFIVSKGPLAHEIELGPNMWGAPMVPQLKVIPLVDLVITHGGNNTVTETIYLGKPMIVLPLFADQLDNAQRVMETGLGIRLHPYKCTEEELLETIEKVLVDDELATKMSIVSKRMQAADNSSRIVNLVEKVAKMAVIPDA